MSAIKYRVTLTKPGFSKPQGWRNTNQPLVYDFLAHEVVWLSKDSIEVTFGQATWPILNVAKLDRLLSDCWFPCMPSETLARDLEIKRLKEEVRRLQFDKEALQSRVRSLTDTLKRVQGLVRNI